ncbi:segregation and condensation protein A [Streptomyces sp. BRA346]|uniref:segregation and condensation protein A n=1 Tax=Streptomyces sp. BRA346 TaxID=2878199 RepID=UPI004063E7C1
MPTNDPHDPPPRRRPLGRGPGAAPPAFEAAPAPARDTRSTPAAETDTEAQDAAVAPVEPAAPDAAARPTARDPGSTAQAADPAVDATPGSGPDESAEPAHERAEGEDDDGADVRPSSAAQDHGGPGGLPAEAGAAAADGTAAADRDAAGDGSAAEDNDAAEDGNGTFILRLDNFEGPFDLLLQLISKHKLDVTEVALSKVTDEFMAHIRAMGPDWDLDQTTEFLVVAATLLDLKAARLLPAAEVEDEADLALLEARDLLFARLLQYRAYKQIADIFHDRLVEEARRYPRTVGLEPHHAALLPDVVIRVGPEGFAKLAVKAMQAKPKPQVYVDHIHAPLVSVREQAEVVVGRLRELGEATFAALTEDAPDVLTVVARFLALLELYRERAVLLDQPEALGSLLVRWTGGAEDGQRPLVTDEFDQEAQPEKAQAQKAQAQEVRT